MPDLHALDIEGDGANFTCHILNLGRIDEQNARVRVDEAANEPRAGDAVDDRTFASYPFHELCSLNEGRVTHALVLVPGPLLIDTPGY